MLLRERQQLRAALRRHDLRLIIIKSHDLRLRERRQRPRGGLLVQRLARRLRLEARRFVVERHNFWFGRIFLSSTGEAVPRQSEKVISQRRTIDGVLGDGRRKGE